MPPGVSTRDIPGNQSDVDGLKRNPSVWKIAADAVRRSAWEVRSGPARQRIMNRADRIEEGGW